MSKHQKKDGNKKQRVRANMRFNKPMGNPASLILPNEVDVWLQFVQTSLLTSGVNPYATKVFRPNAAYDVDPLLGSTATAGFSELAGIFQYYRVITYRYEVEFVNEQTFPVQAIVLNTNINPGTGTIQGYAGNQWCQIHLLSGNAGGPCKHVFKGRHNVGQIVGSAEVEMDDNYASVVNTVPTNTVWLSVSADSGIAGNILSTGVLILVKIWMFIRFFERVPKTS